MTPILTAGPDGGGGKLVTFDAPGLPDTPRSIEPTTQTWLPAPIDGDLAKGRYWLGFVNDAKPTPEELQRRDQIDGEPVKLADGNYWTIPIGEFCPKRLTFDPDTGAEVAVPLDRHKQFTDIANEVFEHFMSDDFHAIAKQKHVITIPNGLKFAGMALSKNYRLNPFAVDVLQLIGQHEAFDVARVAAGMSLLERILAQKKSTELLSQQA
jgi:hypothetical protein